jgi:hypothetical protein
VNAFQEESLRKLRVLRESSVVLGMRLGGEPEPKDRLSEAGQERT